MVILSLCVRFHSNFERKPRNKPASDLTWIEPIGVAANEVGEVPGFGPRHEETAGTGSLAHYRYWKNENIHRIPSTSFMKMSQVSGVSHVSRYLTYFSVLRIRDILIWIGIAIRESVPLTNGSRFGSGSCYFCP
jgi:hypothetical protein